MPPIRTQRYSTITQLDLKTIHQVVIVDIQDEIEATVQSSQGCLEVMSAPRRVHLITHPQQQPQNLEVSTAITGSKRDTDALNKLYDRSPTDENDAFQSSMRSSMQPDDHRARASIRADLASALSKNNLRNHSATLMLRIKKTEDGNDKDRCESPVDAGSSLLGIRSHQEQLPTPTGNSYI